MKKMNAYNLSEGMGNDLKETIEHKFLRINEAFKALKISKVVDYEKVNSYSITSHFTAIEGATLSESETFIFLENGLPIHSKTMIELDMVRDHYQALLYLREQAIKKAPISLSLIQETNRKLMKNTGTKINTALGTVDTSNGEIRNFAVLSGSGGYYMNHQKIHRALDALIKETNDLLKHADNPLKIHILAYDFHYNLVGIHPFGDGNGRVSRLMMNYIQWYSNEPATIINYINKNEYISSLMQTRESKEMNIFRTFMPGQHIEYLEKEIEKFKKQADNVNIDLKQSNDFGLGMFLI